MSDTQQHSEKSALAKKTWSASKKFGFRVLFIFFLAMSIPFSGNWYTNLFTLNWFRPHYRDIYDIARFQPSFTSLFGMQRGGDITDAPDDKTNKKDTKKSHKQHPIDSVSSDTVHKKTAKVTPGQSDRTAGADVLLPERHWLVDYTDWGIALLIAVVGGLIWTLIDRKSKSYELLYYWIRVVVRYRAGIGIIGFGFTKLFPTQMPYPSLGLLNTNFGDFTTQKIYWLSVGIVPWYQVFGGVVEIVAGALLFFRKTTTYGAILLAAALGDITFVNYAYDGGVHVYAFYFVLLSLFLIADDVPDLYNLLIREKHTVPYKVYPDFNKPWLKYTRIG